MIASDNIFCKKCGGTGFVPNQVALGNRMRALRGNESLRDFAKKTGYSAAYLCDLENGKRRWTDRLILMYVVKE